MINAVMEKDPQKAWEFIDVLKRESISTDKAEKVNHQKWFDHFHNLLNYEKSNIDTDRQNYVKQELTNYESLNQISNLDYNITEKEILEASRKLKYNKSSAHHMLKNEMIKTAFPFLCKHIRYKASI